MSKMERPPKWSKYADNMIYNEDFMIPLLSQIVGVAERQGMPNLHQIGKIHIFSLEDNNENRESRLDNGIYKKNSVEMQKPPGIVLKVERKSPILLQICENKNYDRTSRLYLDIDKFKGNLSNLKHRGYVKEKGVVLLLQALKLLDRLSYLYKYRNAFSTFIPKYLTLIGIGNHRFFDDSERILLVAAGCSVADILTDMLSKQKESNASYV